MPHEDRSPPRRRGRLGQEARAEAREELGLIGHNQATALTNLSRQRAIRTGFLPKGGGALARSPLSRRLRNSQRASLLRGDLRLLDAPAPGFRAGQGFSLQPEGFNLALAEFEELGKRVAGGFRVKSGQRRSLFELGSPVGTLLTGRIRRQKLSAGGTVLGPERARNQRTQGLAGRAGFSLGRNRRDRRGGIQFLDD